MLAQTVKEPLRQHLVKVKRLHEADLKAGYGTVYLPYALERKYPTANRKWGWQYVFPVSQISTDPRTGIRRRHHLDETVLQKAVNVAIKKAGITKHASCHTFRRFRSGTGTRLLRTCYKMVMTFAPYKSY